MSRTFVSDRCLVNFTMCQELNLCFKWSSFKFCNTPWAGPLFQAVVKPFVQDVMNWTTISGRCFANCARRHELDLCVKALLCQIYKTLWTGLRYQAVPLSIVQDAMSWTSVSGRFVNCTRRYELDLRIRPFLCQLYKTPWAGPVSGRCIVNCSRCNELDLRVWLFLSQLNTTPWAGPPYEAVAN